MKELVIYDEDRSYLHNLVEYLHEERGLPFKTVGFSEYEKCEKYIEEKGAELLLAQIGLYEKFKNADNVGKCILLSEAAKVGDGDEIFKYQSAKAIVDALLHVFSELEGIMTSGSVNSSKIIGVYSPVNRCGKTSFALTLGQVLACEKRILYLNLEEFSGMEEILNTGFDSDLADLMYQFRISPANVGVKLRKYVRNLHGMDFIPPVNYAPDIRNIGIEYWKSLLMAVSETGIYDELIVDFSNMVGDVTGILEICDSIYMPIRNDKVSMFKINDYEKYILMSERESILEKTVKIMLPYVDGKWDDDYIEQIVWGEMGEYVRSLLEEKVA